MPRGSSSPPTASAEPTTRSTGRCRATTTGRCTAAPTTTSDTVRSKQITNENVGGLKLAWAFQLGALRSNEASAIVIDGTLYISSSSGPKAVYALDAKTGALKWQYQPDVAEDVQPFVCCDLDSRGVSFAGGKILFSQLDGFLVAVDAQTGKQVWKSKVVDYKDGETNTSPPLIVKNMAIIGFSGGEYGARGAIQAFDIATGKQLWKTCTIPGPGEPGNDTWKGDSWQHGGGAAWYVGSYDPKTNTIFYGTSNPGPWNAAVRSTGTADYGKLSNAGSSATLALDPDTGKIKWEIQSTPAEAWDYDGVNELVLADITIQGQKVPVYMKADRNGFFFVANRDAGKLISAEPFVPVNWAKSFDVENDRAIEDPGQAAAARLQGDRHLPGLDGRQKLAADVVQSADRPRLHPEQQHVPDDAGDRHRLSSRGVLPRQRLCRDPRPWRPFRAVAWRSTRRRKSRPGR